MGESRELAANGIPIGHRLRSAFLDHDFRRFDDHFHRVTLLQTQLLGAGASDDAFDQAVADLDDHVRHDGSELYAFHHAGKLISR